MPEELKVEHAVKPRTGESTVYDISYNYNITPISRVMPEPQVTVQSLDLTTNPTMVIRTTSTTISNRVFYTNWTSAAVSLDVDDWTNPRSTWRLKYGTDTYWYATYGLLPSTYSANDYELVSINHLYISANYSGQLLYDIVNGTYKANGCCVALSTSGTRSSISYDVTVKKKSTGEYIDVTGTSNSYSVNNSPYTGNTMALYLPDTSFSAKGDMKGQITMTETPSN